MRRALLAIPTLLGISLISFILVKQIPGDPVRIACGKQCDPRSLARLRDEMHLEEPLWQQYMLFVRSTFDLNSPQNQELLSKGQNSAELADRRDRDRDRPRAEHRHHRRHAPPDARGLQHEHDRDPLLRGADVRRRRVPVRVVHAALAQLGLLELVQRVAAAALDVLGRLRAQLLGAQPVPAVVRACPGRSRRHRTADAVEPARGAARRPPDDLAGAGHDPRQPRPPPGDEARPASRS